MKKEVITGCRADCPDACSLVATFKNGSWKIKGNPVHPITQGFCCKKASYFLKRHLDNSRITTPLLKRNNKWISLSPSEAAEICAEKIQALRDTPERILHIQGHGVRGIFVDSVRYFFDALGTAKTRGSLCDDAGIEASILDFGVLDHNDITDIEYSNFIVNWGRDVNRSSIHLAFFLKKARKKGARVITISPGGCDLNGVCDKHILIKPGTDRFLAAATIKEIIKENKNTLKRIYECPKGRQMLATLHKYSLEELLEASQVSYSDLSELVSIYSSNLCITTLIAWGLQRYLHGGENVRWINALAYLSGHVGKKGEGIYFNISSRRFFSYEGVTYPPGGKKERRTLSLPRLGSELLAADPPISMIWINGTNIVNQAPSTRRIAQAFDSIPFVVVVDAFMTDTAQHADLFLPCSLMWEEEDIVGSAMHNYINFCAPFLQKPKGVLSDREWIEKINALLLNQVELPSRDECYRRAFSSPYLNGASLEKLKETGFLRAKYSQIVFSEGKTALPHGKINLITSLSPPAQENSEYPLQLLTLIRRDYIHSQILPSDHPAPVIYVSSDCYYVRNIEDGSTVNIVTHLGKLAAKLKKLPPGSIHPSAIIYRRDNWASLGGGINQIIDDLITDIGETAAYYSQNARLEPV